MAFEPSPTGAGADGDVPDPSSAVREADILPGTRAGDVAPWAVPASATGGVAVAHRDAVGRGTRWPCVGPVPGGGGSTGGGCVPGERLRRPLMVARCAAVPSLAGPLAVRTPHGGGRLQRAGGVPGGPMPRRWRFWGPRLWRRRRASGRGVDTGAPPAAWRPTRAAGAGPTGALFEALRAVEEVAVAPGVFGLTADVVTRAALGHGKPGTLIRGAAWGVGVHG
jgi:hypothetical protein